MSNMIIHGDSLQEMKTLKGNSVDATKCQELRKERDECRLMFKNLKKKQGGKK